MKIVIILFIFSLSLFGLETKEGEYYISDLKSGGTSLDSYYDTLGIPNIYVGTQCRKKCKKDCCYSVLRNAKGKILRSYSHSDSISTVAKSRYRDKAYLLYNYSYQSGKKTVTKTILVDDKLRSYPVPSYAGSSYVISKDATEVIGVGRRGIYVNGSHILQETNFETSRIENDLDGNIGVVGVDATTRALYVSNLQEIKSANIILASRSDKDGIIAVYPSKDSVYAVAYNLINIYNKGLMGAKVDFKNDIVKSGWIYNHEGQNIGFYPQIYLKDHSLYVKTLNSSTDSSVYFTITSKEYASIDETAPKREGFEDEDSVGFIVGAGVAYLGWEASSDVSDDDNTYAETDYEIANTLFKKVWLQGRIGNTQLAVSYMENEAEEAGGLTKKASNLFSMFVDINELVSKTTVIRIAYESANINGIATFDDKEYGAQNITPFINPIEFSSKLTRISILGMKEKGFYGGFEYTAYETPSAVGFSGSSKNVEYYGLDEKFDISNYEMVFGYDTASYAKRYETDFSKFYLQGLFGLGVSIFDMSSDFKSRVKAESGKKIVDSDFSFVFDAEVQLGYLWQQRFKNLKGFGHAFDVGIKARGIYTASGQSDDSDHTIEADELTMEMSRSDIWYGPYINYNIVF